MITTRCWSVFITILLPVIITISLLSGLETKSHAGEAEMHHPQGWRFTMPKGDATKGRAAFEKFACYVCHEVRGEKFPAAAPGSVLGPELSQMGPLHPLEFFSESVINPSAYAAKKYRGPDGKSTMPSYNDRMTVQELIDLSSYIASLKPKGVAKSVSGRGDDHCFGARNSGGRYRSRRNQRVHGCHDNGLQGDSHLSA